TARRPTSPRWPRWSRPMPGSTRTGVREAIVRRDAVRHRPRGADRVLPRRDRCDAGLELAVHHQRIDEAELRMAEAAGDSAHFGKTHRLPQPDRACVGADDEVELHALVAE